MKKRIPFQVIFLFIFCFQHTTAQVAISTNGAAPDQSAMLDIKSNTKGLLPPRMNSASIAAIVNPADGLVVYNTDTKAMQVFNSARGWSSLETIPSGRIFVSDSFPDPLYPITDYDYLGLFFQSNAFRKNLGALVGQWSTKTLGYPEMAITRQFAYTGATTHKVLIIGNAFSGLNGCDSCMTAYDINTNQLTQETTGRVRRYDEFTATTDTTNSRIFIWGGQDSLNFDNPFPNRTFRGGFIYNYITGAKILIDSSAAAPAPRNGHGAVWAPAANKLLIFCGFPYEFPSPGITNTCFGYNPTSNTWGPLASFPLTARKNAITLFDGSDRVIVWGGNDVSNNVKYYDGAVYTISTNSWSVMSALNAPNRIISNGSWTGADMLVSSPNINQSAYDYKAWKYNLATNTWAQLPDIPLLYNGKTPIMTYGHLWNGTNMFQLSYLIPGTSPLPSIMWSYSFGTNSWTALPGIFPGYFDIQPVQAANAVLFHSSQGAAYRYDPTTGSSAIYQVQDQNFHYYKKK